MKIVKKSMGQVADTDAGGNFVCELKKQDPVTGKSKSIFQRFASIEDAAVWIIENPKWGIRMNPGWSLVYREILIERDG